VSFVVLSSFYSIRNIVRIFHTIKYFLPLPKQCFDALLTKWENQVGTFGVSIRRAKYCIRQEKFIIFPLPNSYQIPIGSLKLIFGIIISLLAEISDVVLDGVYYYKLGSGQLLHNTIHVSDGAIFAMFLFTVFGAIKSPLNVVLVLRQLQETDGSIKTWQIGNMEVTMGANALIGILYEHVNP